MLFSSFCLHPLLSRCLSRHRHVFGFDDAIIILPENKTTFKSQKRSKTKRKTHKHQQDTRQKKSWKNGQNEKTKLHFVCAWKPHTKLNTQRMAILNRRSRLRNTLRIFRVCICSFHSLCLSLSLSPALSGCCFLLVPIIVCVLECMWLGMDKMK